jgi:hypothetical protein
VKAWTHVQLIAEVGDGLSKYINLKIYTWTGSDLVRKPAKKIHEQALHAIACSNYA